MQRTSRFWDVHGSDLSAAKPGRRFAQIGDAFEWARVRLELALDDAAQGRLDGVIGHYLALRRLAPDCEERSVCDGLRALGRLFGEIDEARLSALAHETAALLEGRLSDATYGDGKANMDRQGDAVAAGPAAT